MYSTRHFLFLYHLVMLLGRHEIICMIQLLSLVDRGYSTFILITEYQQTALLSARFWYASSPISVQHIHLCLL
jgi:hypothetical protein